MPHVIIALCILELDLAGLESLKEKRSILKSLLTRLHNAFNISASEVDLQNHIQSAVIAFASVTNATPHAHQTISSVTKWIEKNYPDVEIVHQEIEIL
jgi:uncharacterized protein YlxP (DUF503 family)